MSPSAVVFYPTFLLLVVGAVLSGGAAAQATDSSSTTPDDLRAVTATPADVAEGRRVAETCGRCHGANGISAIKGVPHVAGQRPAYVYNKLRAYQTEKRRDPAMESAVKFLSEDALVKVAAYYSSLDPAQPLPSVAKVPLAPGDPLAAGKAAAAACAGCHGEDGVSKTPGTPSLVGLDPKYFIVAMKDYVNGQRKNEIMKSLATPLTDADLKSVALFYALKKPHRAETPAAGDRAAGKKTAADCAGCHGEQGVSTNPANPSLAGQDAQYLVSALKAYKDGSRAEGTMKNAVSPLDEGAMKNLAAFYSAQQPQPPKVTRPLSIAEWVQRCDRCHGVNGNSTDPRTPAIAGQRADYLEKVLQAYQKGVRKDSVMAAMTSTLTDADITGLGGYYARQKARAFVFVSVCK